RTTVLLPSSFKLSAAAQLSHSVEQARLCQCSFLSSLSAPFIIKPFPGVLIPVQGKQ
ncbi:unnamed protein product, partial [Allacma fusca]